MSLIPPSAILEIAESRVAMLESMPVLTPEQRAENPADADLMIALTDLRLAEAKVDVARLKLEMLRNTPLEPRTPIRVTS